MKGKPVRKVLAGVLLAAVLPVIVGSTSPAHAACTLGNQIYSTAYLTYHSHSAAWGDADFSVRSRVWYRKCVGGNYSVFDKFEVRIGQNDGYCGSVTAWYVNPDLIGSYPYSFNGAEGGQSCVYDNSDKINVFTWNPITEFRVYSDDPSNLKCIGASIEADKFAPDSNYTFGAPQVCVTT